MRAPKLTTRSQAIPPITSQFHSLSDVAWYGSAYQLTSSSLQPLTGRIYTHFSLKVFRYTLLQAKPMWTYIYQWTYIVFLIIFEIGSLLCATASTSKMLIIARAVAGIGAAGIQNGSLTIIARSLSLKKQAATLGTVMAVSQLGLVLGPLVGGALTDYVSWRWCFYINLPIGGLINLAMFFVTLPNSSSNTTTLSPLQIIRQKLDLVGFFILAPALIQLLLALNYGGNEFAWDSSTVIGLFCGSAAMFAVFLAWEHRTGEKALFPLHMVCQRNVACSCLFLFFLGGMTACASYYLPLYFQVVKGVSPMMSGVYLLPNAISQLILVISIGPLGMILTCSLSLTLSHADETLVAKVGYYLPFSIATGAVSSIGNGLTSLFSPSTSTATWIGYQIILGMGRGIGIQSPMIAVQSSVRPEQISIGVSMLSFSQSMGQALFLTLGQVTFINSLKAALSLHASSGNSAAVIAAGAGDVRAVVSKDELPGVLVAYSQGIDHVFYLATGIALGCFCVAWGMGWKDIRKRHT
ncbi:unnamed protein product [Penicillium olsonii]|nr:unnamed protein product [Penicillium olsonii]CAG7932221.1 unnamed protein product [Penicillium olsonii]